MPGWYDCDYNLDPPEDSALDVAYDQACAEWDECWIDVDPSDYTDQYGINYSAKSKLERDALLATFRALVFTSNVDSLRDHIADYFDKWVDHRTDAIVKGWKDDEDDHRIAAHESRMDDY